MVKRLEEANARARDAHVNEAVFKSEQDIAGHPSDQQTTPPVGRDRRSSRSRPVFLALIGLLLASACIVALAWQSSYADAAKLIVARWANSLLPQPAPLASNTSTDAPSAAKMFPELTLRLQTMERDLANMEQQIEQLKTGQEQMVRDNSAITEQLNAALAVAGQLKTSQEQLAAVMLFSTAGSAPKPLRRRKPVPLLSPQATQSPVQ
jgi:hypothetical protein